MKKVTIFKDVFSKEHPYFITVDKALERIRDGASEDKIIHLRKVLNQGEKDKYRKGKCLLPSVCFSGTFRKRNDKDLLEHSGLAILDFDQVGEPEYLKEELASDPFIFACWVSPSGRGIKALVKIPPSKEDHRDHYRGILERYTYADADESNINESRVCLESFDPDIYINWNSKVFTTKKGRPEPESYEHSGEIPEGAIKDKRKIYSILKSWMERTDSFVDGNRHNFYVKFAFNLCEHGVECEDAVDMILEDFDHESPDDAADAIRSGWASKKDKFATKYFEPFESKEGKEYFVFWDVETVKDSIKIHFNRGAFIQWLQKNGVTRLEISPGDWAFLKVSDQIVSRIYKPTIKHMVQDYVAGLPESFDGITREGLMETIRRGAPTFFSTELLDFISEFPVKINRDTTTASFFYFQNSVVYVTKDGYRLIGYAELPGAIWESQIITRPFVVSDKKGGDFEKFCKNVCGGDSIRFDSLRSIIGYLLSNFKDLREFPSVVLMDEQISDFPEGGTGKGLFTQAIKAIKGGRSPEYPGVAMIDGKNWNLDKSFCWQRIDLDTQIIMIQDVVKKFDFEKFFSVTSEGIEVEKKGQQSFYIPFSRSPKIIITTNYTVPGQGNSNERRLVEIEFAQHYNKSNTPFMDFGRLLFDDWDDEEWSRFDNFMMSCVSFYLKNKSESETGQGIIKPVDINISEKKLLGSTAPEFVQWADNEITLNHKYDRQRLHHYFTTHPQYTDFNKLHKRTFNGWVKTWAKYRGYQLEESRSKNDIYYTFIGKSDNDPLAEDEMPF